MRQKVSLNPMTNKKKLFWWKYDVTKGFSLFLLMMTYKREKKRWKYNETKGLSLFPPDDE